MRNYELIKKIYDRCPDFRHREYTFDQLFDRCLDIRDMIASERPEIAKGHPDYNKKTDLAMGLWALDGIIGGRMVQ